METCLFEASMEPMGVYICLADNTRLHTKMDVAYLIVRTRHSKVLNEVLDVKINGFSFIVKLVEEFQGPHRIIILESLSSDSLSNEDSNEFYDVLKEEDEGCYMAEPDVRCPPESNKKEVEDPINPLSNQELVVFNENDNNPRCPKS